MRAGLRLVCISRLIGLWARLALTGRWISCFLLTLVVIMFLETTYIVLSWWAKMVLKVRSMALSCCGSVGTFVVTSTWLISGWTVVFLDGQTMGYWVILVSVLSLYSGRLGWMIKVIRLRHSRVKSRFRTSLLDFSCFITVLRLFLCSWLRRRWRVLLMIASCRLGVTLFRTLIVAGTSWVVIEGSVFMASCVFGLVVFKLLSFRAKVDRSSLVNGRKFLLVGARMMFVCECRNRGVCRVALSLCTAPDTVGRARVSVLVVW